MALDAAQTRRLAAIIRNILEKFQQGQGDAQVELVELVLMAQPALKTMIRSHRVQLAARIDTQLIDAQTRIDALNAEAAEIEAEQAEDTP